MTSSASTDAPVTAAEVITLELPAQARHLRLARLTAAGLGADLGFGLEEVEDLRVAVDEACAVIIDGADAATRLVLRYEIEGPALTVIGTCRASAPADVHPVARELLNVTADGWDVSHHDGSRAFRVRKVAIAGVS
jgi:hypothetical protein